MFKNRKNLVSVSTLGGKNSNMYEKNPSSCPEVFCKKRILKNLAKFTGKQLCCSLSLTVKGVFM